MCLILFALQQHPQYPLIIASNRDEFFDRPAQPAHFWKDHPTIFAGRDLSAKGTWLGVNRRGEFAALTNFREPNSTQPTNDSVSRGELPTDYLASSSPEHLNSYFAQLESSRTRYSGYNLLAGTPSQLGHFSNRGEATPNIPAGIYGLSNGLLDTPWPKVITGKQSLADIVHNTPKSHQSNTSDTLSAALMVMLGNAEQAPDHQLPETGVGLEWERTLSPRFIQGEIYGTRTSTVVLFHKNGDIDFYENNFRSNGKELNSHHQFLRPT